MGSRTVLPILIFLFAVPFFANGLEVISELELITECYSSIPDECSRNNYEADCNSAGKCQCRFPYIPYATNGHSDQPDACENMKCTDSQQCVDLYRGSNTTCLLGDCKCHGGFQFNIETMKCELEDSRLSELGGQCVNVDDCGQDARCTSFNRCHCPVGFRPVTDFTCEKVDCDSDDFCAQNVTVNSVCENPGTGYSKCSCDPSGDYFENLRNFTCTERAPRIGQLCRLPDDDNYRETCGRFAICNFWNRVCACPFGWVPKSNRMDCEELQCQTDMKCSVLFENSICFFGSCKCRDGYVLDHSLQRCVEDLPIWVTVAPPSDVDSDNVSSVDSVTVAFWTRVMVMAFVFATICVLSQLMTKYLEVQRLQLAMKNSNNNCELSVKVSRSPPEYSASGSHLSGKPPPPAYFSA